MYLSNLIIYMCTRVFITLYKYCRNFFVASTRSHNNFTKDNFTKEHPQIASYNIISFEVTVIEREYEKRRGEDQYLDVIRLASSGQWMAVVCIAT